MTLLGSAPHHDRVLAVVLVVADPQSAWGCRVDHLKPDTPQWEAFWQDIGRPDEGLNGTSEAPATDECVQPACPTHHEGLFCASPEGGYWICRNAACDWRVNRKPEPACPTCHGEGRTDEAGGCDGRGKRLTYGLPFTPGTLGPCPDYEPASDPEIEVAMRFVPGLKAHGRRPEPACPCGEPAPPGAKPCTFADPCLYARGKYWPGTTDRVPEETPAQAHNRIVAVRRARLRDAGRRLADRADLLERLSPLDHPYPEEGTL